jgi:hypothetical protein
MGSEQESRRWSVGFNAIGSSISFPPMVLCAVMWVLVAQAAVFLEAPTSPNC